MGRNYLRLILVFLATCVSPALSRLVSQPAGPAPDSVRVVRRVATTARLAAQEYGLGVSGGTVVLAPEVEEARLFLLEASRAAERLPARHAERTRAALAKLQALVAAVAEPDSVSRLVESMVAELGRALGVELDEIPEFTPSLARGAEVFRQGCAACHGPVGRGDGPAAPGLTPAPANLADAAALRDASPLDFYRRITMGVAGTSMAAYETTLSAADRWAVALYASTLRLPPARGRPPASFAAFPTTARLSDAQLADSLGSASQELVAAARTAGGEVRDYGRIFAAVRGHLDSSGTLAEAGRAEPARSHAVDAYMAFEAVERELRVKDPALVAELEQAFARVREASAAPGADLSRARSELARGLERAERAVGRSLPPLALFLQSVLILVREGLEAILVVGALMTFLVKLGAADRRRDLHWGVGAAVGASLLTALAIETVFRLSPAHQEALEAVTMVLATAMLFWVSYWLLSKIEVARWNRFVRSRLSEALDRRSSLALASVAFLAVYREGFETVLFYKALLGAGRAPGGVAVGFLAGCLVLAILFLLFYRFGVRLPLRPFFAGTGAVLYYMAFVFAGKGMHALQEAGWVAATWVNGVPYWAGIGVYPTVETLAAQALLLVALAFALVWVFAVRPIRLRAVGALPQPSREGTSR
jgi:high-affinity iron transporter